jgi:hypothetical protein
MKKAVLFFVVFILVALNIETAEAYFYATDPVKLRAGVPTDVFVAGFGDNQGDQFLKAAILAAKVSRDRFPQRQRLILSAVNGNLHGEKSMLRSAGFNVVKGDDDDFTRSRMLKSMQNLSSPIMSLQFFGHANTYNGFRLQSKTDRLDQEDSEFAAIGSLLHRNAIVVFNSCNSGWLIARTGARLWNRPVFGSMNGSNFQEMMSDGQWYFHDDGDFPSNLRRIGPTTQVVAQSEDCSAGKCLRLKPGNKPYTDTFGTFGRGLGFYRVFAPSAIAFLVPQALVHYTLLNPSENPISLKSSKDDLAKAAADWMCPQDKSNQKRNACREAVLTRSFEKDRYMSFFNGKAVSCKDTTCGTRVKCSPLKAMFFMVPCYSEDTSSARSTDFSDQLKQIYEGLDLFEQGKLAL